MDKDKSKARLLSRAATLDPNAAELAPEETALSEPPVHHFILSQFKQKYDQLKGQFEAKKKEADGLLYDKKKLEIELLNRNVDYYEKEIVRLRSELQKFQLENEENKHRFFIAENSRKDLEATSKVRHEELKQTLKQLEKEKISVVQLKYQLKETGKNYGNVITDVEKRNHEISQKYDQTAAALLKTEADLKATKAENDKLKTRCDQLERTMKEKDEQEAAFNEKVELSEYRSRHRIEDLQEEIKDISSKESDKIKKLEAQVKELESKRKSEEFLLAQKVDAASYAQQLRKKEEEVARLEERLRELTFSLTQKEQKVVVLQEKLRNVCSIDLLEESQQKYADQLNNHKIAERALESRVITLEKELQLAKLARTGVPMAQDPRMKADFQQLLKGQIEENSKLKVELSSKIDEVFALKTRIEQQQVRESLLQNEIDILKKRQRADEKNSKIGYEIDLQNLRNEVDSMRRKVEVTEAKLAIKAKEVKDKDAFISSVIIGRSRQEDVPFVVAELKRVFEAEYVSKLAEANLKIQDLLKRTGQ